MTPSLLDSPDRLLSRREFCELFGVTDRTARNWAAKGIGPRIYRPGGGDIRYRLSEVLAWLEQECVA